MPTRYRVVRVKGLEPESFIIVGIDFDEHAITSTSKAMTEPELRAHMRETGASVDEINAWIEQGREYPE
jgi:hypothetical protein